ncbi:heme-containing dehydratase protein [Xylogone sp. PMI_703]|nr:heme-containing dehydratase protein [Xylogone sp. PMI_703]
MVLILPFWERQPKSKTSIFALFGIQFTGQLIDTKKSYFKSLINLLKGKDMSINVDYYIQPPQPNIGICHSTTVIISYWLESDDYRIWWESIPVQRFWKDTILIDEEAGVWREVLTMPVGRFMYISSRHARAGFAKTPGIEDLSYVETDPEKDKKYWGIYRERMPDWVNDPFDSPYTIESSSSLDNGKIPITIMDPSTKERTIHRGRVYLPKGIDNVVWVHEYQDYTEMDARENELWKEKITAHAESWINYLDTRRDEGGVLSFQKLVYAHATSEGDVVPNPGITSQFVCFLDLAHFEATGKNHRGHRQARSSLERLYYAPKGEMNGERGRLHIIVEMMVLKSGDFEAEYVGCREGTGLMAYENLITSG